MPEMVVVDTNIFEYAYVMPTKVEFVEIHHLASEFLLNFERKVGIFTSK